jgi:hypothetical protein
MQHLVYQYVISHGMNGKRKSIRLKSVRNKPLMKHLCLATVLLCLIASPRIQGDETEKYPPEATHYLLKELPDFEWGGEKFRADPYIRVAAELQAMGKEKGRDLLFALTLAPKRSSATFILARMLFVPKGGEFRAPRLGRPFCVGGTNYEDWPLEPITLVDGIPFLIVRGYRGTGIPEETRAYVKYCMENCDWNTFHFKPKSAKEKKQALEKLLASRKWKTDWKTPIGSYEKNFLANQLK